MIAAQRLGKRHAFGKRRDTGVLIIRRWEQEVRPKYQLYIESFARRIGPKPKIQKLTWRPIALNSPLTKSSLDEVGMVAGVLKGGSLMAMGQQKDRQGDLMVSWSEMPRSPGHVFYDRLQLVLIEGG